MFLLNFTIEDLLVQNITGFILRIMTQLLMTTQTLKIEESTSYQNKNTTIQFFSVLKQRYVKNFKKFVGLSNHLGLQSETIHQS